MLIEPATAADIPRLCELLALLFTQEAEFQPDASKQAEGLRRIIGSPAVGAILAARDGADIVGMVNVLFTVSTALGTPITVSLDATRLPIVSATWSDARPIEVTRAGGRVELRLGEVALTGIVLLRAD